jgi:hypothetical protein
MTIIKARRLKAWLESWGIFTIGFRTSYNEPIYQVY